jgi:hypothetical protein
MASDVPRVSFALPVRNGGEAIRRCLDSLLAQDFEDYEIVISDNASSDGTQDVIREYAARDSRIRPFLNEQDVGQIENFNRVVHLARGEYFRWIGAEDWLEPDYASSCVAVLDRDRGAIVVTNFFRIHLDGGVSRYQEYHGELLESERPERRFARMLWSFHAGASLYEPLYSLIRRSTLLETSLIQMMVKADRILAAELSLAGRFHHHRACLAHRWKPTGETVHSEKYLRRYRPDHSAALQSNPWRQFRALISIVWRTPLSTRQRMVCLRAAILFLAKESNRDSKRRLRRFRDRLRGTIERISGRPQAPTR